MGRLFGEDPKRDFYKILKSKKDTKVCKFQGLSGHILDFFKMYFASHIPKSGFFDFLKIFL